MAEPLLCVCGAPAKWLQWTALAHAVPLTAPAHLDSLRRHPNHTQLVRSVAPPGGKREEGRATVKGQERNTHTQILEYITSKPE